MSLAFVVRAGLSPSRLHAPWGLGAELDSEKQMHEEGKVKSFNMSECTMLKFNVFLANGHQTTLIILKTILVRG